MKRAVAMCSAVLALAAGAAQAEDLAPRDTAVIGPAGSGGVGVFNPLRWVVAEGLELSGHPLLAVGAPHLEARWALPAGVADWPLAVSLEGGLWLPWASFTSGPPLGVAGYLTPSCAVHEAEPQRANTCAAPGVYLVPRLGAAASWLGAAGATTLRLWGALGVPLTGDRPTPLDAPAPVDLALAPVFQGWRVHLAARHDYAVVPWLRVAAELAVDRVGQGEGPPGRDLWTYSAWLGGDVRTSEHTRLSLGVAYWNSDQRRRELRTDAEGFSHYAAVRSHDVWPTFDFLWSWQ